jgi:tetratricopeptide (TPR) repeat protein
MIAYFGFPRAQEDAAERAVLAALELVDATAKLNHRSELGAGSLQVGVGVHCGTVVITPAAGGEPNIVGEAPTLAAQLPALADPGAVLISETVRELVAEQFATVVLASTTVKGAAGPLRLYRVLRPKPSRHRARSRQSDRPLVGRDDELRLLLGRWERARAGDGQVVLLVGEPGIGKTRLVEEFRAKSRAAPALESDTAPYFANTPFHAVVQLVDRVLGAGSADVRRHRLDDALANARATPEAAPLIAELIGLPTPDMPVLAPEQRRARLLAVLGDWLLDAARSQPLLLVGEDLQWIDPSTLELLQAIVEQGAGAPLMLLLTARPEFRPPWTQRAHHAQIALSRLNARESRSLVDSVMAGAGLAHEVVEAVVERTDGVPLFVEELTRLMVERAGRPGADEIPATLLASLAARLDRLGPAKEAAQLAAVLGREFSYRLLAAVWPKPESELKAALGALTDAELIHARGVPPEAAYRFRHALVQSAAYEALLKRRRRELHASVAETIESQFEALARAQPEVLARHWSEAGVADKAAVAWKAAGDAASARRAFKEAETAYRHGLAELAGMPEGAERDRRELELTSVLGRALQLTRGYAASEALEMAARARALAEKTGSLHQLIREEARIWNAVTTSGDYAGAAALAERIKALAGEEASQPSWQLFSLNAEVQTRFYTGDLLGVEEYFRRFVELIDSPGFRQPASNIVIPIGVAALAAWILGQPAEARRRLARALALAEADKDPYGLATSLHFQGLLNACEGDAAAAEANAQRMLALCEENGFSYVSFLARAHLGWALGQLGRADEGAKRMHDNLRTASGASVGRTFGLMMLGETEAVTGALAQALATLDSALSCNPQERVFRPLILLRRAELRREAGQAALAHADLAEALALARSMSANAWTPRIEAALGEEAPAGDQDSAA